MFIGVVNHWVAFIIEKKGAKALDSYKYEPYKVGKKHEHKFWLLDSSNLIHLDKTELELPEVIMDRVRERIVLGLKASSKF